MVFWLPFPGGHPRQTRKISLPTVSQDGKTRSQDESQYDILDWSARDWEDYNYALPTGGAGGGEGAWKRDTLPKLSDCLPGLEAADIDALLRDLPIPTPGDVPGMTVDETIEVYHGIYHGIYHAIYQHIYNDIYSAIYTMPVFCH